ncbi:hypothetical protein ATO05_10165 [Staphylococcus epidermidis]|nr:hypothetical protein ATO05_10165 [Staphylococcus epidermidis]
MFISEIVHTEDSFLLKLYYKFNFATEPNILSNTKKIETDNIDSKEDIITPKASKKNEQKQSIFSKLFKKK